MFRKMGLFLCILFVFIFSSCGKETGKNDDDSDSRSGSSDGSSTSDCKTLDGFYNDTGYISIGLKLKPGQMGSDIADIAIPACQKGQFIFNGTCWDSVSFNNNNGEVAFVKSTTREVILKPQERLSSLMSQYAERIHSYINRCDINSMVGYSSIQCDVWMGHYPSLYYFAYYTPFVLQDWSMKLQDGFYVSNKISSFKFRTSYGKCAKSNSASYNVYDWYNDGTISLSGVTIKLPLSKNKFKSFFPNLSPITCPYRYDDSWVCYQLNNSWGSSDFYFDENENLNYLRLNYN